jgi:hypothetical protein
MSQVTNLAFFRARRGQGEALGAAPAALVEPTWLEAGCLNFVIHSPARTFSSYIFLTKRAGFAPGLLPNTGPLLGREGVAQNIPSVVMISWSLRGECSWRFSKRQPDTARVGIRRAVN